jgi:N-hydroxyarylamine O-acetyltransferase
LQPDPSRAWLGGYLELLGLDRQKPTLEYLKKLTRAHLSRVPFENVTSILRREAAGDDRVPTLDRGAELQAWQNRGGGGLCFEVVDMFGTFLSGLGFKVHPVLATISFVGSHQGLVVEIENDRYLVDAGNGAPFFEPIPLSEPVEVSQVGLAYRFRAPEDTPNLLVQDRLIDGNWQPFCKYDLGPASDSDRELAYLRHHMRGHSWVVDNLTLVRCTETEVWSLRDDRLSHFSASGKSVREIVSDAEYRAIAADLFQLPNAPIAEARRALGSPRAQPSVR